MKKILTSLCLLVLALACFFAQPARAEAATIEKGTCGKNLTWVFDDTGTLTISGKGAMTEYKKSSDVPWAEHLFQSVRKVVVKPGVTTLSSYACYCANSIEEISLPDTLTKIGNEVFYGCGILKSITIPAGVTSIGTKLFECCYQLEKINVSKANPAYSSDSKGVLYDKNKTILLATPQLLSGTYTVPSSVKTIAAGAFMGREMLQKVQGMAGVTTIGESAFRDCTSLESFTVPGGVTVLPDYVLMNCQNLRRLVIHENLVSVGVEFMSLCTSLTSVTVSNKNPVFSADSCGVLMDKNKTCLYYAPGGLTGTYTVPSTVKVIGRAAFYGCEKLEKIVISEGVESVEDYVFWACYGLKEAYISSSVTSFGNGVFDQCIKLEKITVAKENPCFSSDAYGVLFADSYYGTILLQVPAGIKIKAYLVPDYVAMIQSYAFAYNQNLEEVYLLDNVEYLSNGTFLSCKKLHTVALPATLPYIDEYTFRCETVLKHLYYQGTEEQWKALPIYNWNDSLRDTTTIHYNSTGPKLKLKTQPQNMVAENSSTAKITVKASGAGLNYSWYYMKKGATKYKKSGNQLTNTLSLKMSSQWDGAKFYCVITDIFGNTVQTEVASLKLGNLAKITTQPKSVSVVLGKTAKITVKASGDGIKYTWYYMKKGATKYTKSGNQKTQTLSLKTSASWNGAKFYCVVSDQYGNTVKSSVVTLTVQNPLKITTQPKSAVVKSGKTAKVTLKATGDGLKYQWYYAKKGSSKFTKSSVTTASYSVKMTSSVNGRKVYCVVTDKYGNSVKSDTVTLYKGTPAKITTQPKSVTVKKGSTAKVTVKATGDGLKYTWYYLKPGATKYAKSSITKNVFSVKMAAAWKNAKVYCVISDKYGNTVKSSVVTLKMK